MRTIGQASIKDIILIVYFEFLTKSLNRSPVTNAGGGSKCTSSVLSAVSKGNKSQ